MLFRSGLEYGTSDDEKEDHDDDGRVGETAERGLGRHNPAEHERSHTAEGDNVGPDFTNQKENDRKNKDEDGQGLMKRLRVAPKLHPKGDDGVHS